MTNNLLTGPTLKLRAVEPADVDLLLEWENDTSIWNVSNTLTPFSRFEIEEYVLNAKRDIFSARQLRLMIDLQINNEILIRYAFELLHLHQLYCNISRKNPVSIRIFENLGFIRCGEKREWLNTGDSWMDEIMFQLIP